MIARIRIKRLPAVFSRYPSLFVAAILALCLGVWSGIFGSIWYLRGIVVSVPGTEQLRGIGSMAQATTLFDREGKPAFTIFKEQRIDVALARVSPNLIDAIIAIFKAGSPSRNGPPPRARSD